ncbi:hypothetical protein [Micromonospora humi]|uniref:PknH-like extracellular domain-containing protein n=1 Tax=Micromonospora humi TaxID=745366 RepID=A0A1C5K2F7_9ACTN|nr:hypothetical protein [Micromonospora humi]SCG77000.1 hypothetical protein GA0070213_11779 [Micromonospora humi]
MTRRPIVAATLLIALVGCAPAPDPEKPPTIVAPALAAPSPTDGGAAVALRDRHAATGSLVGLAEKPEHASERLDSDGVACGQPLPLLEREAVSTRVFGTPKGTPPEEFVELAQETVVYPDDATAADAVRRIFDLLEACDRDEEDGQVTAGHSAADLPTGVGVPGRVVAATMTLPDGTRFPHRYGCVHRGRVTRCVGVWTRSAATTGTWFDRAVLATAAGLRAPR